MKIMKTKKRSSLRFSPFFCSDLGEDPPKKGLHSNSVCIAAQSPRGGGAWLNFAYYSEVFMHYWRPKGGHGTMALLNTPWDQYLLGVHVSLTKLN